MKKKISFLFIIVILLFLFIVFYFIYLNPIFTYDYFLKNANNKNLNTKKTIDNYFYEKFLNNNNYTITIKAEKAEFKKNSIILLVNGVYNVTDNRNGLNFHIEAEKLYIDSISNTHYFHAVSINKKSLLSDSRHNYKLTAKEIFYINISQKIFAFNSASIMFDNNNQYQAESFIYSLRPKTLELKSNVKAVLSMMHFNSAENPITEDESNIYNELNLNADYIKTDRNKNSFKMDGHAVLTSNKNKIFADYIYFKSHNNIVNNLTIKNGSLKSLINTMQFSSLTIIRSNSKSKFIIEKSFINHSEYGNFRIYKGIIIFNQNNIPGYKLTGNEINALLYLNLRTYILTSEYVSLEYNKSKEIVQFKANKINSEMKNINSTILANASSLSGTFKKDSIQFYGKDINYTHIDSNKNFMIKGNKGKIVNGNIYFSGNTTFKNNLSLYNVTANSTKWLNNNSKQFYGNITLTSFFQNSDFTVKSQHLSINSSDSKIIAENKVYGFFTVNNYEFHAHDLTIINNKPVSLSQITYFSPLKCFNIEKGFYKINSLQLDNSSFSLNLITFNYNNLLITIKNGVKQSTNNELELTNIAITYKDKNNKTHKIKAQNGLITGNDILQLSNFNLSTISSDAINLISFELDILKNQTVYYTNNGTSTYLIK